MYNVTKLFNFNESIKPQDIENHHLYFYIQAAIRLGINYKIIKKGSIVEMRYKDKNWIMIKASNPLNSHTGVMVSRSKPITDTILADHGIPVPKHKTVRNLEEIKRAYEDFNKSIVIKPHAGIEGKGVTILPEISELEDAYKYVNSFKNYKDKPIAVEEFIQGDNYRILVLGNKVIAAAKRIPASVKGDGISTIRKLIEESNKERAHKNLPTIKIDQELCRRLKNEKRTLETIPEKDETVYLRYNCNLCSGGETIECTDKIHTEYKKICIKACKYLGLKLGGVDLITPNISNPNVKYAINEINHAPGLRIHYYPTEGKPIDVAYNIIKYILENIK